MNLVALRTFQAVARAGSITGGAKAIGISQATASSSISSLEAHLGTPLFLRTRSGVVQTEAGKLLYKRCDPVFLALEEITQDVRDLSNETVGTFVVGCHDPLGNYFLPPFLADFLPAHPRIDLELWNRSSAEVRQAVVERTVHFGLVVNAEPHDDLVMRRAFLDRIQLFGPQALSLDDAKHAFREATLVYPNRAPFTTLLRTLQSAGYTFGRLLPTGDLGLARTLSRTLGYGLLPRRVALDSTPNVLTAVNEELPAYDDQIHLVYRVDFPKTRAARLLRDGLLAHAETL